MPISKYSCPHCRVVLQMSRPAPAGKAIKCPECGEKFTVRAGANGRAPSQTGQARRAEGADSIKRKPPAAAPRPTAGEDDEGGTYGVLANEEVGPMPELIPQEKTNRKREAEDHVQRPATLLQTTGLLTAVINFVAVFVWLFPLVFSEHLVEPEFADANGQLVRKAWDDVTPAEMATIHVQEKAVRVFRVVAAVLCVLATLYGGLIYHGALKMQYLESSAWARTACIMALVPVDFWLLGLPAGIMGLMALRREGIQEGFEEAAQSGDSKRAGKKRKRKRHKRSWVPAAVITGVVGVPLVVVLAVVAYRLGHKGVADVPGRVGGPASAGKAPPATGGGAVAKGRGVGETFSGMHPIGTYGDPDEEYLAVAFTPDGAKILAAGEKGVAHMWDVESGQEVRRFEGHSGRIGSMAVSPDGLRLITGSVDHSAIIWDMNTGKEQNRLKHHTDEVTSVSFSPNGRRRAVTGSRDGHTVAWDVTSGKQLQFGLWGRPVGAVAFAPDGMNVAVGLANGTVQLWIVDGGLVKSWEQPHGGIVSVAFSPDGGRLAFGTDDGFWGAINMTTQEVMNVGQRNMQVTDKGPARGLAASPNSRWVCFGEAAYGQSDIFDLNTLARLFGTGIGPQVRINSVAFSPDGTRLLIGPAKKGVVLQELEWE